MTLGSLLLLNKTSNNNSNNSSSNSQKLGTTPNTTGASSPGFNPFGATRTSKPASESRIENQNQTVDLKTVETQSQTVAKNQTVIKTTETVQTVTKKTESKDIIVTNLNLKSDSTAYIFEPKNQTNISEKMTITPTVTKSNLTSADAESAGVEKDSKPGLVSTIKGTILSKFTASRTSYPNEMNTLDKFLLLNEKIVSGMNNNNNNNDTGSAVSPFSASMIENPQRIKDVVTEASVELPKQAILENFVHHNPWEVLQYKTWDEAHQYMHSLFESPTSYISPGERLLKLIGSDPRTRSNAALAELSSVFCDKGSAKWCAPYREKGFLYFFATMEDTYAGILHPKLDEFISRPWRRYAREKASCILEYYEKKVVPMREEGIVNGLSFDEIDKKEITIMENLAESVLLENLMYCFCQESGSEHWVGVVRQMLFDLPGWAAMFHRMEKFPHAEGPVQPMLEDDNTNFNNSLPKSKDDTYARVSILEFAAVQSILLRSSMERMAKEAGLMETDNNDNINNSSGNSMLKIFDNNNSVGGHGNRHAGTLMSLAPAKEGSPTTVAQSSPTNLTSAGPPALGPNDSKGYAAGTPLSMRPDLQALLLGASSGENSSSNSDGTNGGNGNNMIKFQTLGKMLAKTPLIRTVGLKEEPHLQNPSALAWLDQNASQREALEEEFERYTLSIIGSNANKNAGNGPGVDKNNNKLLSRKGTIGNPLPEPKRPTMQFYTCIDERECSFRRHLEESTDCVSYAKDEIETFGVAGFFDFALRYQSADDFPECVLAPEGSQPPQNHKVKEFFVGKRHKFGDPVVEHGHGESESKEVQKYRAMQKRLAQLYLLWETWSFCPIRSLILSLFFWPLSVIHLIGICFFPTQKRIIVEQILNYINPKPETDYDLPFTFKEGAERLAKVFNNIGLNNRGGPGSSGPAGNFDNRYGFAPLICVLGHGSRTVNNPFDAAHNCGACGGREGGPNARIMCRYANNPEVRRILRDEFKIYIPEDTHFIGGFHDTSSELVELFDTDVTQYGLGKKVQEEGFSQHKKLISDCEKIIYEARGRNSLERCSKFMQAQVGTSLEEAISHVHTRSTDLGQARPELGHATNAAVVVGRRELTRGTFLARRFFLPSYDPFNDDERGTHLEFVITPALIVCSGINLEYYFSTTDGGAGTKVAMNLTGHIGVMQGTSGDLLIGLPTQMTEMHSPVRALYLVDAPVKRLEAVLSRKKALADLVYGNWVLMFCRDPISGVIYRQKNGDFIPVELQDVPMELQSPVNNNSLSNLGTNNLNNVEGDIKYEEYSPTNLVNKLRRTMSGTMKMAKERLNIKDNNSSDINNSNTSNSNYQVTSYESELKTEAAKTPVQGGTVPMNFGRSESKDIRRAVELDIKGQPTRAEYCKKFVPFTHHLGYCLHRVNREILVAYACLLGTVAICLFGITIRHLTFWFYDDDKILEAYGAETISPIAQHLDNYLLKHHLDNAWRDTFIVLGATFISACGLEFSRRYLHGEFMFDRFLILHLGLYLGIVTIVLFNSLAYKLVGWVILGFCGSFLIGAFNERPTARENASYVFGVYQLSDHAFLGAVAWVRSLQEGGAFYRERLANSSDENEIESESLPLDTWFIELALSFCLVTAAAIKTSQFPFTNLFMRSVEGSSPTSALSDATISAHCGIVLLSVSLPLWYDTASGLGRVLLFSYGLLTAMYSGLVCNIHADRKGAIVAATGATIGSIYVILSFGYVDLALTLAFGHSCLRMGQMLRSHNVILEFHELKSALGYFEYSSSHTGNVDPKSFNANAKPMAIHPSLYRLCWALYRFNADLQLPHVFHRLPVSFKEFCLRPRMLERGEQFMITVLLITVAGLPFTPITDLKEEFLIYLLLNHPIIAVLVIFTFVTTATMAVWLVFTSILDPRRFRHSANRFGDYKGQTGEDRRSAIKESESRGNILTDGGGKNLKTPLLGDK